MEAGRVVFAVGEERLTRVKLQPGFPYRAMRMGFEQTGWSPESVAAVAYAFAEGASEAALMRRSQRLDAGRGTAGELRESQWHWTGVARHPAARRAELAALPRIPGLDTLDDEYMPPKPWHKRQVYTACSVSPTLDHGVHRWALDRWVRRSAADHATYTAQLDAGLRAFELRDKLRRFDHHDTHAANAFFHAGVERALCLTLDGYGSGNAGAVYVADLRGLDTQTQDGDAAPAGSVLRCLHRFAYPNSLGQFYGVVTSALGFKPSRHEGKIVGLASYGDASILRDVLRSRFEVVEGDIRIKAAENGWFARALAERFPKRDVAAAYQTVLEEVVTEAVAHWVAATGLDTVCVSGGVHANVKLNQRIAEIPGVRRVDVYPNMGDGGCATGAAMLCFPRDAFAKPPATPPVVYHGPEYGDDDVRAALDEAGVAYEDFSSGEGRGDGDQVTVEERVAELLADAKIVARFDGRMEYGPRALGNRSILYHAGDNAVNLWLNHQLGRTEFMPFAPACLDEEAHRLFVGVDKAREAARFMTVTFDCTPEMARLCPAAVHIDNTARPQLVRAEDNPGFHRVLRAYYQRTGVPALVNTSFNMHEEPIVCSPADAVRAFLNGNLHYLAIGPCVAAHPNLEQLLGEPQPSELTAHAKRAA